MGLEGEIQRQGMAGYCGEPRPQQIGRRVGKAADGQQGQQPGGGVPESQRAAYWDTQPVLHHGLVKGGGVRAGMGAFPEAADELEVVLKIGNR